MLINPYINFPGTAEEAFNHYKSVFGGEFAQLQRYKETAEAGKMSAADGEKLMHIAMPIGNGNVLMGTDAVDSIGRPLTVGNNFNLSVSADSKEDADKMFNAMAVGGHITMPMGDTFWGSYFGMLTDKFGINWMFSYDKPKA